MSAAKHTPGPWLDWDTLEWLRDPQKLLTNTADARLIAAAPELLEAAQELAARYPLDPELTRLQLAIAKAGGRS